MANSECHCDRSSDLLIASAVAETIGLCPKYRITRACGVAARNDSRDSTTPPVYNCLSY